MSSDSSRHHYIPKFMLKEFTNDNGKLWVYNKKKDLIEPKAKSPKSVFFEWDRNSTFLGKNKYVWLEELYSGLDDSMVKTYRKIIQTSEQVQNEREHINLALDIIIFVNFIRWRVPARDKIVFEIYDKHEIGELSLKTINKTTGEEIKNEELNQFLKNLDVFRKAQSSAIIWEPWYNFNHVKFVSERVRLLTGNQIPTLICDNPFIERSISDNVEEISEFFFPLSKDKMAYYLSDSSKVELDSKAAYLIELSKFEVAEKYVACENKEILNVFVSEYQSKRGNNISFTDELFNYVNGI
jgi:hypothetical protein